MLGFGLGASLSFQRTAGLRRLLDAFEKQLGAAIADATRNKRTTLNPSLERDVGGALSLSCLKRLGRA